MSHNRDSLHTLNHRSNTLLEKIATNTNEIHVDVGAVNLNTDTLEAKLDTFSGHSNNTIAIGDGSTQLRSVSLGYNQSAGQVRSFLVDSDGHQQIDLVSGGDITSKLDTFAGAGNNNIGEGSSKLQVFNYGRDVAAGNFKPMVVNSSAEQIVALSTVDNTVLDNISSHTGTVDGCVASNKMNVNISSTSGGGLATEAKQDALEASLTSIESKIDVLDTVLDNSLLKHTSIDSNITACNTGAVVVSSSALPSGGATSALQTTGNNSLATIAGDTTSIDGKITACNTGAVVVSSSALPSGGATSSLQSTGNTSLATIAGDTTSIDGKITACNTGAVVVSSSALPSGGATSALQGGGLPAALSSGNLKVSIQEGNISGFATSTLQGTTNGKLDTLEASLGSIETDIEATNTALATIDTVLDNAEAHLGNIDTGVDVLEACVGSNKVNVNISSDGAGLATQTTLAAAEAHLGNIDAGVDVLEACVGSNKVNVNISSGNISGFATATLQGTTNTKLDALETTLTAIETDAAALEVLQTTTNTKLDTLETTLSNIETSVQLLDNAVDSASLNVNMNIAGNDVDSNSGVKGANTQRVVIATDDINVAKITSANELTTTQLHNNTTIAGGADDTHGTTITLGHNPKSITILATSANSNVPGSAITIGALASMDNSNFFDIAQATDTGGNISLITRGDLLQERFIVIPDCRFKFLKVKITNATGNSTQFNSFVCF